jgi:hypothetical protein
MDQTRLNMGTVGQRLEAARREKGVTVSEAGEKTRILPKLIEAMEADDFTSLAAPVYVKGFLRLYAQYLGLDPAPLIQEYAGQHAAAGRPQLADEVKGNLVLQDRMDAAEPIAAAGRKKGSLGGTMAQPGGGALPMRLVAGSVILILLVGVVVLSVKQCDSDDVPVPDVQAPAPTARTPLFSDLPHVYVVRPGVVELEQ